VPEFLVGGEQPASRRIERKIARRLALRRNVLDQRNGARGLINREHRDAVVAAIRRINELARPIHLHLAPVLVPVKSAGSVETVFISVSVPDAAFHPRVVKRDPISLTR